MKKHEHDQGNVRAVQPSRQARIQQLLFTGAAFGTAVLLFGAASDPKFPRFVGE
jgi:hypothetical protein